ncbi:MAG: 50S ribosomal protein L11 methyltransferase [Chitinophagales bacterium]
MNEYIQIEFAVLSAEQKDVLIAKLSLAGFEGFEETDAGLKAFIVKKNFIDNDVTDIAGELKVAFTKSLIEETNWNKVWESNFDPVVVDDFVAIRADFHEPVANVQHELIITPKMSFGTGHHATTVLMVQQMRLVDFVDKKVFDFGTGTGVLAILAENLRAKKVIAIDNDDWSIENAAENISRNDCSRIELKKANFPPAEPTFDIILANINKNVILENFERLFNLLAPGGTLLLSGLLKEDEDVIFRKSIEYSLQLIQTTVRDNWLCLRFSC